MLKRIAHGGRVDVRMKRNCNERHRVACHLAVDVDKLPQAKLQALRLCQNLAPRES